MGETELIDRIIQQIKERMDGMERRIDERIDQFLKLLDDHIAGSGLVYDNFRKDIKELYQSSEVQREHIAVLRNRIDSVEERMKDKDSRGKFSVEMVFMGVAITVSIVIGILGLVWQ